MPILRIDKRKYTGIQFTFSLLVFQKAMTPFEAMTGHTAPSSNGLLAEIF
jgi:hypothetical protein